MDIVELTKKLISYKSFSYQEMELAQCISSLLNTKNIPHVLDRYNPGKYLNKHGMQDSANIVVQVGQGDENLILYAHTDVVAGPDELFSPWEQDGYLFGRGASDMKSSLAGLLYVLLSDYEKLKKAEKKIVFAFIADEETSATGIRRFLETIRHVHLHKSKVILMEPTDNFSFVENGGKGYAFLDLEGHSKDVMKVLYNVLEQKTRILEKYPDLDDGFGISSLEITKVVTKGAFVVDKRVEGVACHASRPYQGDNPIEKAMREYSDISIMRSARDCGPNSLASYVEIERGNTKEETRMLKAHIDLRLNRAASKEHVLLNEVLGIIPNSVQVSIRDKGQAFLNENPELQRICSEGISDDLPTTIAIGGSDAPYLAEYTQDIISGFGPGELKYCHKDDERVKISELQRTPQVIRQIIDNFLNS